MMKLALKMADVPMDKKSASKMVIKSIAAKQKPRRPAEPKKKTK